MSGNEFLGYILTTIVLLILRNFLKSDEKKYEARNKILTGFIGVWIVGGLLALFLNGDSTSLDRECSDPNLIGSVKCR